jgi:tetratricopeptide (TPR) repeat protein
VSARSASGIACLLLLAGAAVGRAQEPVRDAGAAAARARAEGLEFERQGRFAEAAAAYGGALEVQPANVALLTALERVLARIGRLERMVVPLERAVTAIPEDEILRGLQFRLGARVGGPDSAAAIAARWMAVLPHSAMPYREWARWLAERGDTDAALAVLTEGRRRFGDVALAEYTAPTLAQVSDWVGAAAQWALAAAVNPAVLSPASTSLRRAPEGARADVIASLIDDSNPAGRWLAADLMLEWNRPEAGWVLLAGSLPADRVEARRLVTRFADRATAIQTTEGRRTLGYALEHLAQLTEGAAAQRARVRAARAFADAGDLEGARRVLSQVTLDPDVESADAVEAMATFIRVLADAGRVEDAERQYREWEPRFRSGEGQQIRERLAWGWLGRGDLERAAALVERDSTVAALAIQGWIALYRGDLAGAKVRLAAAGPAAQTREATTRSASMLALLEQLDVPQLPEFGEALLAVTQGDTAKALDRIERAAHRLAPASGRGDLLAFAAELAIAWGDPAAAEPLLLAALAADPEGPSAPAAGLRLASIYADAGRNDEARNRLEHLILTFPDSAVLPEARRLLDRVRGAIPNT